jgi:hypothetical protein
MTTPWQVLVDWDPNSNCTGTYDHISEGVMACAPLESSSRSLLVGGVIRFEIDPLGKQQGRPT